MRWTTALPLALALAALAFGCRDGGADEPTPATIYALDAVGGEELWQARVPIADVSAIAEHGGVVFVVGYNACPGGAAELLALDREDGRVLWRTYAYGSNCGGLDKIAATDEIVVACQGGSLLGLDVRSGAERWRNGGQCRAPSPLLAGESVLAGGSLVDIATGETRWTVEMDSRARPIGVASEVVVSVLSERTERFGEDRRIVLAHDLASGDERWRFDLGPVEERDVSVIAGDGVVAASRYEYAPDGITRTDEVVVLEAMSGAAVRRIGYEPGTIPRVIAVAHGRVLISVWDGRNTTLNTSDIATGSAEEIHSVAVDEFSRPPVVDDQGFLFVTRSGRIVRLGGWLPEISGSVVGVGPGRLYTAKPGRPTQIDY